MHILCITPTLPGMYGIHALLLSRVKQCQVTLVGHRGKMTASLPEFNANVIRVKGDEALLGLARNTLTNEHRAANGNIIATTLREATLAPVDLIIYDALWCSPSDALRAQFPDAKWVADVATTPLSTLEALPLDLADALFTRQPFLADQCHRIWPDARIFNSHLPVSFHMLTPKKPGLWYRLRGLAHEMPEDYVNVNGVILAPNVPIVMYLYTESTAPYFEEFLSHYAKNPITRHSHFVVYQCYPGKLTLPDNLPKATIMQRLPLHEHRVLLSRTRSVVYLNQDGPVDLVALEALAAGAPITGWPHPGLTPYLRPPIAEWVAPDQYTALNASIRTQLESFERGQLYHYKVSKALPRELDARKVVRKDMLSLLKLNKA